MAYARSSRRRVLDMARDVALGATRFSADPGAVAAQPP